MRQGPNPKRSRGRNNGRRPNVPSRMQTFDSNGPDVRIRGSAYQVHEKYLQLARDAASSGDRIMAESYFQHAEHYYRIIATFQEQQNGSDPNRRFQQDGGYGGQDYRGGSQGGENGDEFGEDGGDGHQPRLDNGYGQPSEGPSQQGQPEAERRPSGDYRQQQDAPYRAQSDGPYQQEPEREERSREFEDRRPAQTEDRRPAQTEDRSGRLHLNGEGRDDARPESRGEDPAPRQGTERGPMERGGPQVYGPVRYGAPMESADEQPAAAEPARRAPRPRRERSPTAQPPLPPDVEPVSES